MALRSLLDILDGSDDRRKFLRALGKKRDVDLAEEFGLPAYSVSRLRNALGIPRFLKKKSVEALLGKGRRAAMPDVEISRRLGVNKCYVMKVRQSRGQAKCDLTRFRRGELLRAYAGAEREAD